MFILIGIRTGGIEFPEYVSKKKSRLEEYLKEEGYYFSKKFGLYIDDRTNGGSGIDYIIEEIDELK